MDEPAAAVAVVQSRGHLLLLRRVHRAGDPWSGQICLPGGRRQSPEEDLLATAIRETREECGLELAPAQCRAMLPAAVAGRASGRQLLVQPFLFELDRLSVLQPCLQETAVAAWVELAVLAAPQRHGWYAMARPGGQALEPGIEVLGGVLWGFTYGVLSGHYLWPRPLRDAAVDLQ